jgi:methyl coenzyme M reductase gamma subunit
MGYADYDAVSGGGAMGKDIQGNGTRQRALVFGDSMVRCTAEHFARKSIIVESFRGVTVRTLANIIGTRNMELAMYGDYGGYI